MLRSPAGGELADQPDQLLEDHGEFGAGPGTLHKLIMYMPARHLQPDVQKAAPGGSGLLRYGGRAVVPRGAAYRAIF